MSSGLSDKLNNYEVVPPARTWEKIVLELDNSELSKKFPSRLYNIQIAPPVFVWQNIAVALDESALVNHYAGKLVGIEIAPPVGAWNKIKTLLDAEQEILSERRRILPFMKYAAAAAIIGFLAWGGIVLFSNKSEEGKLTKQQSTPPEGNSQKTSDDKTLNFTDENIAVSDINASLEEARNDAALEASKKTYARLDVGVTRSKIKNAAHFFFIPDNYEPSGTRGFNAEPEVTSFTDIPSRYIMLMTPDGKIIRMSKKLRELVCCVSGEEQDKECVDQMKKWREKIANPSATHSSSNFMDILSLVNAMQDN